MVHGKGEEVNRDRQKAVFSSKRSKEKKYVSIFD